MVKIMEQLLSLNNQVVNSCNPMWIVTAATLVPITVYLLMKFRFTFWWRRNIPGPEPSFIPDIFTEIGKETHLFRHKRWVDKYGKLLGFWDFTTPKLMVADADLIKRMLVQDFNMIVDRRVDGFDHPLERKMVVFQEGDDWKKSRSLMTPAFSSAKFKPMFEQFQTCCEKQNKYMKYLLSQGKAGNLDAFNLFARYFSDIISRSIFSVSFLESYEDEDKIERSLYEWFQTNRFKLFISSIFPRWFKTLINFSIFNTAAMKYPVSLFKHMIEERRKGDLNSQQAQDLLKLMLEGGPNIDWTDKNVVGNLLLMYLAGYLSSAYLFSFLIYHFAKFPHIVENIIGEIDELEASGETVNLETIQKRFVYLDAVISETQRLYPTTTYTERKISCKEYNFEYKGNQYKIPKDTILYFPIFLIHRDPEYYDEPDKFDETRFLPEKKTTLHNYAFLPFGHGPRNCIGTRFALVSMKLLVVQIIKQYKFTFVDEKVDPMADLSGTVDEMLTALPIKIKLEER